MGVNSPSALLPLCTASRPLSRSCPTSSSLAASLSLSNQCPYVTVFQKHSRANRPTPPSGPPKPFQDHTRHCFCNRCRVRRNSSTLLIGLESSRGHEEIAQARLLALCTQRSCRAPGCEIAVGGSTAEQQDARSLQEINPAQTVTLVPANQAERDSMYVNIHKHWALGAEKKTPCRVFPEWPCSNYLCM